MLNFMPDFIFFRIFAVKVQTKTNAYDIKRKGY